MDAIFKRLRLCGVDIPEPCEENTLTWCFSQQLRTKDNAFFRYFFDNYLLLSLEYTIQRTQLAEDISAYHKNNRSRAFRIRLQEQLKNTLMLAELLEYVYRANLNVPRETARLIKEQSRYREWLLTLGYTFPTALPAVPVSSTISKTLREITGTGNFPRNLLGRSLRLSVSISLLAACCELYRNFISHINQIALPILRYAAWIFFIPRLFTNLFLTFKHLIPGNWMSQEERDLGWKARLTTQIQRRWVELANDLGWISLGLLNCFILTGALLAPIGFYLTTVILIHDVILASLRAHIEINRLKKVELEYLQLLQNPNLEPFEKAQTERYLSHLHQRITYEQKRLSIQIVNTSVLLLGFCLAFPLFAAIPILAVIGMTLSVTTTIASFIAMKYMEKHKPDDRVPSVADVGLFNRPAPQRHPSLTSVRSAEPLVW